VHRKVDIRLHGKRNSKLPWRKAGQPSHLVDVVDSDQQVVNKEFSLSARTWYGIDVIQTPFFWQERPLEGFRGVPWDPC
jgi:hypothetical protein